MRSKGDVSRVFLATVSHGLGFLFLFSGFQRQRFGIFLAAMRSVGDVSDVLLSFSRAFQRRRFESFCGVLLSLSVVRSKGDVSRVFLATVSHGIGTKPAGVLLFRMCSPKTFFLGFAWWLAGFPSFCFYLVGSKGNVSAFFWLQCVPSVTFRTFCHLSVVRSKGDVSRVFVAFCYAIAFSSAFQRWRLESFS